MKIFGVLSVVLIACFAHAADPPNFGGKKEVLTINTDQYEFTIQKNGQCDLRDIAGAHFFDNVTPLVRVVGEEKERTVRTRWQQSARGMVNDVLGEGQGFLFAGDGFEWQVNTYPSKPYLSVKLVFINDGKEAVQVSRLTPWSAGASGAGGLSLGADTGGAYILDNGRLFRGFDDYATVTKGSALGNWNIAAYNPASGRSLIAGFLSNLVAYTEFEVRKPGEGTEVAAFRADCVYDPPVTVAPGGRLESEMLYLAVSEGNPLLGLERFAKAEALWNKKRNAPPFIPHGWDSWSTRYHKNIDEASMLMELDALDTKLKRYGWNHFAMDAGWERGRGDWEPDPKKFPNGLKPIVDEVHRRGMTAGLWIDPFTVSKDAPIAKEHPEWMAKPGGPGLMLVGLDNFVFDVTAPGAEEYIRGLARKIGRDWGFDGLIEADFVYDLLMAEKYADAGATKISAFRRGMLALREGMGPGKFIMSMTPQPVNGAIVDGVRLGHDCDPVWRTGSRMGNWGAVETLTNAVRKWYLGTHLFVSDQDCAFFDAPSVRARWHTEDKPALTRAQSVAWCTGAALTGGAVKIGMPYSELGDAEVDVLRRLLPAPPRAARPIDLFQEGEPRIWHLPLKTAAGQWDIVGLFNWDAEKEAIITVPFEALELSGGYYTVFDFWPQHYEGTARGQLDVRVPAGSVRLLGLRRLEDAPMLIACDRHYTQGALDHTAITWDATSRTLKGEFTAVENTPYVITVSVPEGYAPQAASWSGGEAVMAREATVATLRFSVGASAGGVASWVVQY